jgi:hypothetical protein
MTTLTLAQFERIDGLMMDCLRRPDLDSLFADQAKNRKSIQDWFRKEWELTDELVAAFGLDYVNDYPCAVECAAAVVAGALLCTIEVAA